MTTAAAAMDRGTSSFGVYNVKLGMWVFLLSEVMFFTGLIGTYIILRFANPEQFARPGEVLNVPLTAANTFFLICSSVTMVKAYAEIERGNQQGLKRYLVATALIGMLFVGIQGVEYWKLAHEGFVPVAALYKAVGRHAAEAGEAGAVGAAVLGGPLYGTTFYTMTGFHGAHVTIGVLCLWFTVYQAYRGRYSAQNVAGVEAMGLYWHFVDLVWIILFTIVYLI